MQNNKRIYGCNLIYLVSLESEVSPVSGLMAPQAVQSAFLSTFLISISNADNRYPLFQTQNIILVPRASGRWIFFSYSLHIRIIVNCLYVPYPCDNRIQTEYGKFTISAVITQYHIKMAIAGFDRRRTSGDSDI